MKYYVTVGYDRYERTYEIPFSSFERNRNRPYDILSGRTDAIVTNDGALSLRNDNVNYVYVYKRDREESE